MDTSPNILPPLPEVPLMTIADFLLSRIAEDEAAAKAAGERSVEWRSYHGSVQGGEFTEPNQEWDDDGGGSITIVYDEGTPHAPEAEHIARHNPARILAECAAKRAIVDVHRSERWSPGLGCATCRERGDIIEFPCDTLRHLAAVYADHPDYRQEWAA